MRRTAMSVAAGAALALGALAPGAQATNYRWNELDGGVNNPVNSVAVSQSGAVYIGGNFTKVGPGGDSCHGKVSWGCGANGAGTSALNVASWNGAAWSALGAGSEREVTAVAVGAAGTVYAGGDFTVGDSKDDYSLSAWSGGAWTSLGEVVADPTQGWSGAPTIYAIAFAPNGDVYVGGFFSSIGGVAANGVAKWDGAKWTALSNGMRGAVLALAVDGAGTVYAGGSFRFLGSSTPNVVGPEVGYLARWDGTAWSAVGAGMNSVVSSLAVTAQKHVFASGLFDYSGDGRSVLNHLAEWVGDHWAPVTDAGRINGIFDGAHLAMDPSGTLLYATGPQTFGSVKTGGTASWNGAAWTSLGPDTSGVNGASLAVAPDGSVVVGGPFWKTCCSYGPAVGDHVAIYAPIPAPTIAAITPSSGTTAGGDAVTITGTGFNGVTSVTLDGVALPYTVVDPTTITLTTTAHAAGVAPIQVVADGGPVSSTFTYVTPPPTIASVSPSFGRVAGGDKLTITGTGFTGVTGVTVGGAAAAYTVVSPTLITLTTPAHAAGIAPIQVVAAGGPVSATYTYQPTLALVPGSAKVGGLVLGKAKVGLPVSVTAGTWKPAGPAVTYQWYVTANPLWAAPSSILGAKSPSYKPAAKLKGKQLWVVLTATKPGAFPGSARIRVGQIA